MPKGSQEGRVFEKGGKLYLDFYAETPHGRKRMRPPLRIDDTPGNRLLASKKLAHVLQSIEFGQEWESVLGVRVGGAALRRNPTFAEFVEEWLPGAGSARSTRDSYGYIARNVWCPLLGSRRMHSITTTLLSGVIATGASGKKQNTFRSYVKVLRNIMRSATDAGIYSADGNPAKPIKLPAKGRSRQAQGAQDALEVGDIIRAGYELLEPPYGLMLDLLWSSGMRVGELLALRRACVATDGGSLAIEGTAYRGVATARPKTEESRRTVALSPRLSAGLADHLKGVSGEYIFSAVTNPSRAMAREQLQWKWAIVRDHLKKTGLTMHHARHSYVTRALAHGMSSIQVAAVLGDSVSVIEQHYVKLLASSETAREQVALQSIMDAGINAGTMWAHNPPATGVSGAPLGRAEEPQPA